MFIKRIYLCVSIKYNLEQIYISDHKNYGQTIGHYVSLNKYDKILHSHRPL